MRYGILIFSIFLLTQCGNNTMKETTKDAEPSTFKNVFLVDSAFCKERGLYWSHFSIEYPDNVEVEIPKDGKSYVTFRVKEGQEIVEELWIGHTTLRNADRPGVNEHLHNWVKVFSANCLECFKEEFTGERPFLDRPTHMIRGTQNYGEWGQAAELIYPGDYKLQLILPFPEKDYLMYTARITMLANAKSPIKSYDDFEKGVGTIGKMIKTFQYHEHNR